jgi:hypothetical protein
LAAIWKPLGEGGFFIDFYFLHFYTKNICTCLFRMRLDLHSLFVLQVSYLFTVLWIQVRRIAPYVFGPLGFVIILYGSGSASFHPSMKWHSPIGSMPFHRAQKAREFQGPTPSHFPSGNSPQIMQERHSGPGGGGGVFLHRKGMLAERWKKIVAFL